MVNFQNVSVDFMTMEEKYKETLSRLKGDVIIRVAEYIWKHRARYITAREISDATGLIHKSVCSSRGQIVNGYGWNFKKRNTSYLLINITLEKNKKYLKMLKNQKKQKQEKEHKTSNDVERHEASPILNNIDKINKVFKY